MACSALIHHPWWFPWGPKPGSIATFPEHQQVFLAFPFGLSFLPFPLSFIPRPFPFPSFHFLPIRSNSLPSRSCSCPLGSVHRNRKEQVQGTWASPFPAKRTYMNKKLPSLCSSPLEKMSNFKTNRAKEKQGNSFGHWFCFSCI